MTKVKITAEQERLVKDSLHHNSLTYMLRMAVTYHIEKCYSNSLSVEQKAIYALDSFSTPDIVSVFLGEYEVEDDSRPKIKITTEQERLVKEVLKGVTTDKELGSILSWVVRYHVSSDYEAQTLTQITTEALKDFSTSDIVRIFLGEYDVDWTAKSRLREKYTFAKLNSGVNYAKGVEDTLEAFNLSLEEEK